jgi:protein-S-isoprenylcysteine O-methyltransferase Ste14
MVPAASVILLSNLSGLAHGAAAGAAGVLRLIGMVLTCAFYALVIFCYLRRGPAAATSGSVTAHAAALAATWLPFALPFVRGAPPGAVRQGVSDVLLVLGTTWAVWSLHFLGRNVSVLAQVRGLADRGPYRWVRHPLYLGELVSSLGIAVAANSLAAVAIWLVLCGLQAYRALREEQVLLQALPGYRSYRSRTAALVPGLF